MLFYCVSRSENEATSWTRFIAIVQSKMADENSISRPISILWKTLDFLRFPGAILIETFFLRVVAHKLQCVMAASVKRMYKHQETLPTLLTITRKKIHLILVLSA